MIITAHREEKAKLNVRSISIMVCWFRKAIVAAQEIEHATARAP